jgi:hypothetical protein
MKRFALPTSFLWICFALFAAPAAQGQLLDSSVGLSAGLVKLFGTVTGFSAKADVQVLTNGQETLRTPMTFALLDGKMRMDFDMTAMRGRDVQPAIVNGMKQLKLDRVSSLIRLDKRITHILFTGVRGYVNLEIPEADAAAAQKNVQIQRTPLGKVIVDKHPCNKSKVIVKSAQGAVLLEATTWNAEDLKDFPIQIAVQAKEGTTVLRFTQIELTRPAAAQFEVPSGYKEYSSAETLILAATQKQIKSPAKPATTAKKTSPSSKPKPAVPVNSASPPVKPAIKPSKAPAQPVRTNTNAAPRSIVKPSPAKR